MRVVPWTMFFTVLVPARPREALIALVISNAFVPLLYLQQVHIGAAPALSVGQFLPIFVLPYAANTVLAYVAARVVHSLGVEVRRAHDLGSYRLDVLLGRGGMGEVWRASHRMLARPAAIKLIRRDTLARDPALAATAVDRFEREAQVIASLQSPHTVALYDFGVTDDGSLFYVMELLEGVNLETLVRKFGPLPPERVVYLLRQACSSLAEAHHRGLVHRDIKPANIYLCHRGMEHDVVKVLDFGIVKKAVTDNEPAARALTTANDIAGTPDFMAPEIAMGAANIDGRADIYALGCVAFWLLTGRPVFEEATPMAAIIAHVEISRYRRALPPSSKSRRQWIKSFSTAWQRILRRDRPPPRRSRRASLPSHSRARGLNKARFAGGMHTARLQRRSMRRIKQRWPACAFPRRRRRPDLKPTEKPTSEATEAAQLRGLPRDQRLCHRPVARPAD